jgi:hypothetical protein
MSELNYSGPDRRVTPQGLRGPQNTPGRRLVDRVSRPKAGMSGVTAAALLLVALFVAVILMQG